MPFDTTPPKPRIPSFIRRLAGEPLLHFLVLGGLLFAILSFRGGINSSRPEEIVVTPAVVVRLAQLHQVQTGAMPDAETREWLVQNWLREEMMVREAKALGLEEGDELVRRRLVQKLEFLQGDIAAAQEPDEASLGAFLAAHPERFTAPAQVSITHVYFSPDKRGREKARADAEAARLMLVAGADAASLGDAFPLRRDYQDMTEQGLTRVFGQQPIVAAAFSAEPGQWVGPVQSGFGWHLIKITTRAAARPLSVEEAGDALIAAWKEDRRAAFDAQRLSDLKSKYDIRRADQAPPQSP